MKSFRDQTPEEQKASIKLVALSILLAAPYVLWVVWLGINDKLDGAPLERRLLILAVLIVDILISVVVLSHARKKFFHRE